MDPSSLQKAYHTAKRRAGIRKSGGIHALRHAFATHLLEAGVDVHTIQRLMGHRSITTTMRYWHLTHASLTAQATRLDLLDGTLPIPPQA
jgi:site-specific recombinase XerD